MKKRVPLDLSPAIYAELVATSEALDHTTVSETVRRAIRLYAVLARRQAEGKKTMTVRLEVL